MSKKDKLLSLSFLFFLACLNVTLKTPDTPNCRSALRNHSQYRSVRPQYLAPISPKNAKERWGVQETPPETAFRPPSVRVRQSNSECAFWQFHRRSNQTKDSLCRLSD